MTTQKTPPLNAKGIYTVTMPYQLQPNTLYTCKAIRSFADLIDLGVDILASYYTPVGLVKADMDADAAAGANIITLMSDTAPTVHVPDTYITAFPNMGNVAYKTVVLALSLGPLPDSLDLTFAKSQIATAASDAIGLVPDVKEYLAPTTGVMSQEQADTAETARQAAIVTRTTDHAKLLALQAQYDDLQTRYSAMEQILITKGLLEPTP